LRNSGRNPSTRLLSYEIGPPTDEVISCGAEIDEHDRYIRIRRLRMADGVPLAILTNHLPASLGITEDDLNNSESVGLYGILRARGLHLRVAHQTVGARLMTAAEARLLTERRPAACLTALRVVYDDNGRLVEVGQHAYRASQYALEISLVP
jgi:DNA-binding GntR family transcriptional regulator